jgi:recombination protein RecT
MTQQNSTAVAVQDQIKRSLQELAPQFKAALPPHIPVERFIRVAQTAILTNADILKCERNSLFAACLRSAQDGLLPDGKEAALVSFGGKATYMPMVAGILKKVRNSGDLGSITPEIVYEKDEFEYWVDEKGPHLKHRPALLLPDRGEPLGAYAVAITKDGASYIEFMTRQQIDDVASMSRSKDGPWKGKFASEMAKKTVMRRLSKRLPMSTDLEELLHSDDQFYDLNKKDENEEKPVAEKSSRLSKLMQEKTATLKADVQAEVVPPNAEEPDGPV